MTAIHRYETLRIKYLKMGLIILALNAVQLIVIVNETMFGKVFQIATIVAVLMMVTPFLVTFKDRVWFINREWLIKIGYSLSFVYLLFSAVFMGITTLGDWEGCYIYTPTNWNACTAKLLFVQKAFPLASSWLTMREMFGWGFSGGYEAVGMLATLIFAASVISLTWLFGGLLTRYRLNFKVSSTLVLVALALYYTAYVYLVNQSAYPGIILSLAGIAAVQALNWSLSKKSRI